MLPFEQIKAIENALGLVRIRPVLLSRLWNPLRSV